jgi:EAL domain-containing protein (putative c-di-GMP-specific phosphodiesterase class I)
MGCNLFQGYYFAKPMSVSDYEKLCEAKNWTSKKLSMDSKTPF